MKTKLNASLMIEQNYSEIRVSPRGDGDHHRELDAAEEKRGHPVELLRSVRDRVRSIIIGIACNEPRGGATRSTRAAAE